MPAHAHNTHTHIHIYIHISRSPIVSAGWWKTKFPSCNVFMNLHLSSCITVYRFLSSVSYFLSVILCDTFFTCLQSSFASCLGLLRIIVRVSSFENIVKTLKSFIFIISDVLMAFVDWNKRNERKKSRGAQTLYSIFILMPILWFYKHATTINYRDGNNCTHIIL